MQVAKRGSRHLVQAPPRDWDRAHLQFHTHPRINVRFTTPDPMKPRKVILGRMALWGEWYFNTTF
eukprot:3831188-Prymnesium_polylepis.1